ncbi:hypothetical protein [Nitrospina gracilis]|uniref:hypothetical protein n=1 Tax=Nitrospina gracilis TaxID=35801 RepID=UPI001F36F741|nr:hypothetical protein [Nitrospina gracilis]MCF8720191.1 hypothetical protein [Nitrospina gracilis Nb-211]
MANLKYVYYLFGGFIGFVCGLIIQMIFMALERSGTLILGNFARDYGVLGRILIYLVEGIPYMGVALGVLLVHYMFGKQFAEENQNDAGKED